MRRPKTVVALACAVSVFAGCNVPGPPPAGIDRVASLGFSRNLAGVQPSHSTSWMSSGTQKQSSLLYVSNWGTPSVTVYSYFNGSGLLLVGKLTGFRLPAGMCTDRAGNVWIADFKGRALYEYAHGGTKPIFTIKQYKEHPYDCSVDANNGNLAVANASPQWNVTVYPAGQHKGTAYNSPHRLRAVTFLAYDNQSNLYVDGQQERLRPQLFELFKGGNELMPLTLKGASLNSPGAVSWVNPTLLLGDANVQNQGKAGAYELLVSGSAATVVGTLHFQGTQQPGGFWRRAGRVVVPDVTGNVVRIYNLSDGSLFTTLTSGVSAPFGAVVSQSN